MNFFEYFFLGPLIKETFFYGISYILISLAIGKFLLQRPAIEGCAVGFLIIIASSNLTLYLLRGSTLSISYTFFIFLIIFSVLVWFIRAIPLPTREDMEPHGFAGFGIICFIGLVTWCMNALIPEPSAGFAVFQVLTPLYLEASFAEGIVLAADQWNMGPGVVADNLYYAADLQGVALVAKSITSGDAHSALFAASIISAILALSVLTAALGRNFISIVVFLALVLIFFRFGGAFKTLLGNNWGDKTLILAGSLILYYMAQCRDLSKMTVAVAFASSFLVFGRHYGAFEGAFISGGLILVCWWQRKEMNWRGYFLVLALAGVFALKELIQLVKHGPFFPRTNKASVASETGLDAHLEGLAVDWGIVPSATILDLPIPAGVFVLPGLLLLLWTIGKWSHKMSTTLTVAAAPLLLPVSATVLELVTGYRPSTGFTKVFVICVVLFAWYPALLISLAEPHFHLWKYVRRAPLGAAVVFGVLAIGIAVPGVLWVKTRPIAQLSLENYLGNALETYRDNNHDLRVAQMVKASPQAALVRNRPILHFYYEPGLGLRYFLGGDQRRDFDMWSDRVQNRVTSHPNLAGLLVELGYPSLYLSYPDASGKAAKRGYTEWQRYRETFETLEDQDWVSGVYQFGFAKLFVLDQKILQAAADSGTPD